MGVTAYQLGQERDSAMVALISRLRFMTADQVSRCLFQGRRRVAARRLQRLVETGRLRSQRLEGSSGPAVYWTPTRIYSRAVREALAVSELYCRLMETRPTTAKLLRFDVEVPHTTVRPDAVIVTATEGRPRAVLLEWDTGTTALERVAAKIPAYEAYAKSGNYRQTAWWQPGIDVALVLAVPEPRREPLSQLWRRLTTALPPVVVDHARLISNPWRVLSN